MEVMLTSGHFNFLEQEAGTSSSEEVDSEIDSSSSDDIDESSDSASD